VNNYLDDWLRARKKKGPVTEVKREVIDLRENRKAYGRYFSGKPTKKTGLSNGWRQTEERLQAERKNLRSALQKEERQAKL
jgi:hypothetical protein